MTRSLFGRFHRRAKILTVVAVLACATLVFAYTRFAGHAPAIPTFKVKPGEFLDTIAVHGDIQAARSITIAAPPDAGLLQILKLVADGAPVKKDDVIVEFDATKTRQDLAEDLSTLKSAQADIEQARAQGRLTEEQDKTAVTKAQYAVQDARLDASKQEIVSRIEGAEARLALADAEQALKQAQQQLKSDVDLNRATVQSKQNASRKAAFDAERARRALASMIVLAPSAGTVSLVSVWHDGNNAPFRAGDRAWSGAPIAELPDPASLHIAARVDETERGRLAVSQPVTVQFDAIPDRQFTGKIQHIGTIATEDFSAGWPIPRNFDLEISLDQSDPRLRSGMSAQVSIIVQRVPNAIAIPLQASFLKSGQTVAFVWDGSHFRRQVIRVDRRSRDRLLVSSGLKPGDQLALEDPTGKE